MASQPMPTRDDFAAMLDDMFGEAGVQGAQPPGGGLGAKMGEAPCKNSQLNYEYKYINVYT